MSGAIEVLWVLRPPILRSPVVSVVVVVLVVGCVDLPSQHGADALYVGCVVVTECLAQVTKVIQWPCDSVPACKDLTAVSSLSHPSLFSQFAQISTYCLLTVFPETPLSQ